ncbi:MAG: pilus assembly protein N-terminal domain-containing protein [Paracoccus sp. (in: a-proteobacteria)]|uniref:type II and III secretion system protein family protein n=1 Tax=Paracoccus sp. TaxID=267 RepID=UPI0026DF9260|nr:pilus assembly protein N-terminal domain-containing protein [Paracoccus sp. (in: a-proteobacteria)]MDO5621557.1 pilus assembly protein N-terminal domain-containing protein [Paracoccus sp. (in: a-proteobacteria)]
MTATFLRQFALSALLVLILALSAAANTVLNLTEGEGRAFNLPEGAANVFVADPMVADVQASSPTSIYITGVSQGRTNIIVRDMQDRTMIDFAVTVRRGTGRVESLLGPGLSLHDQGDAVVISGQAQDIGAARSASAVRSALEAQDVPVIDNSTYAGATQVSLRVRFVEASRSDLRRVGVDLAALGRSAGGPLRVVTGLGDPTGFLDGGAISGPAAGGRATAGSFTIDTLIDALEQRGVVQILSEPTLTTVSGQTASFRAGGEFAYPINQGDGVISAAFKEYGVSIDFTPTILPGNRIAVHVRPEVSFVDKTNSVSVDGFQVPGVSVRRADTIVEVGSGQSFAIAGLYEQFSESSSSGVPGMSRIFGRNSRTRSERELMIFITPYLAGAQDATEARSQRPAPQRSVGFITR